MTSKCFSVVLIIALSLALTTPAHADKLTSDAHGIEAGILGVIAGIVIVTVLAIHYSKKRSVTGCVASVDNGMTITDEKDKQIYALSGNTAGIKPGDRMMVKGKKAKHAGSGKSRVWEARDVSKDFGVCQP
jgi:uncharacterized protein YebE (UPF0316 family)